MIKTASLKLNCFTNYFLTLPDKIDLPQSKIKKLAKMGQPNAHSCNNLDIVDVSISSKNMIPVYQFEIQNYKYT